LQISHVSERDKETAVDPALMDTVIDSLKIKQR
jgi:hypothetical protein